MRKSGILMNISSLASEYGIGNLGRAAYDFCDFLSEAGQKYWQILPINPTSYGDSPYQSPSAFAGNPYYIDPEILRERGLLKQNEIDNYFFGSCETNIDYYLLFQNRYPLLRTAYQRFEKSDAFFAFCEENSFWLDDFALFMALKERDHYRSWIYWDEEYKTRNADATEKFKDKFSEMIGFYKFLQFEFFSQWADLKAYANKLGIEIIGDMPIYVALDSAEVWSMPKLFCLGEDRMPEKVAGCPPDAFSDKGQLWGNPLYRWDEMEKDGYDWWIKRLGMAKKLFDRVRIDHFRGFESYYAIDYKREDAVVGEWEKGPGMKLFDKAAKRLGKLDIIAEDLGFLTPEVDKLLSDSGFPGMRVMQFAFDPDGDSKYLPHNHIPKCVLYTGTHDNDTALGWYDSLEGRQKEFADRYLRIKNRGEAADAVISAAMASVAETVIVPIQDYLGLGSEARMNIPSTVGGNWVFRVGREDLDKELAHKIKDYSVIYRRC